MQLFKLTFVALCTFFLTNNCYSAATERKTAEDRPTSSQQLFSTHNLFFFLDDTEKKMGGAAADALYTAIEQKVPIVTSTSLFCAIFFYTPTLAELRDKEPSGSAARYIEITDTYVSRLQHRLAGLIASRTNLSQEEQNKIVKILNSEYIDPMIDDAQMKSGLLRQNSSFIKEWVDGKWIIKIVDADRKLLLLLPTGYKNALNKFDLATYKSLPEPLAIDAPLTVAEYYTGLKIDHMETLNTLTELLKFPSPASLLSSYFVPLLLNNTIFVPRTEYYKKGWSASIPRWTFLLLGHGSIGTQQVALSISDFQKTLDYCEARITTTFVICISCYSFGTNTKLIYQDAHASLPPKTYNFIIATNGISDAYSYVFSALKIGQLTSGNIDFDRKKLTIKPFDFQQFIKNTTIPAVGTVDFTKMLYPVIPLRIARYSHLSIPEIRLPNRQWFMVADSANTVAMLGETFAKTCKKIDLQKYFTKNIITQTEPAVTKKRVSPSAYLMFSPAILCTLDFSFTKGPDGNLPIFVPMAPSVPMDSTGTKYRAMYYIKEISAPQLTIFDIVTMFINGIPQGLQYTLIIGTLTIKNTKLPLTDFKISTLKKKDTENEFQLNIIYNFNGKYYQKTVSFYNPKSGRMYDFEAQIADKGFELVKGTIPAVKTPFFIQEITRIKDERHNIEKLETILTRRQRAQPLMKAFTQFNNDLVALTQKVR